MNSHPLDIQIGGNHYKGFAIQPVEFIHQNNIGFIAGCIIKRIVRFDQPTGKGLQDIDKIIHELDLLIDQINKGFAAYTPFNSLKDLPIAVKHFTTLNKLTSSQSEIINLVTRHNLLEGDGINDLHYAMGVMSRARSSQVSS